jgi:hypothetical protein
LRAMLPNHIEDKIMKPNILTPIQQELYDNMSGELSELKVSNEDIITVLRVMSVDASKVREENDQLEFSLHDQACLEDAVLDLMAKSSVSDRVKTQLLYDLHDRFNEFLED